MITFWKKLLNYSAETFSPVIQHYKGNKWGYSGAVFYEPDNSFSIHVYDVKTTPTKNKITTLAHELGHAKDFSINGCSEKYASALRSWSMGTLTEYEKEVIIRAEKRAWVFGKEIIDYLNSGPTICTLYCIAGVKGINDYFNTLVIKKKQRLYKM